MQADHENPFETRLAEIVREIHVDGAQRRHPDWVASRKSEFLAYFIRWHRAMWDDRKAQNRPARARDDRFRKSGCDEFRLVSIAVRGQIRSVLFENATL